jgi:hypothetical protein
MRPTFVWVDALLRGHQATYIKSQGRKLRSCVLREHKYPYSCSLQLTACLRFFSQLRSTQGMLKLQGKHSRSWRKILPLPRIKYWTKVRTLALISYITLKRVTQWQKY